MSKKKEEGVEKIGNYFISDDKPIEFINSGCTLLNIIMGGGYPLGRMVNIIGDKSTGKCIKNAMILNTCGLQLLDKKIESDPDGITENKQILVVNKNTKAVSTHSYKEKVRKTYKITTRHGFELECTPDHPILIWTSDCTEEMQKSSQLQIGDVAIIAKGTNSFGSNLECNEDLAFLLGCIVANGNNPKCGRIRISTHKQYLKDKLKQIGGSLGLKVKILPKEVAIYNKKFSLFVWNNFFESKEKFTAHFKFVPKQILEAPLHIQTSFLRALIDCDGYYNKRTLEYYTASSVLAKQVQLMLLNIGIIANKIPIDGTYIGTKFYDHTYWKVTFGGNYINKYAEIVGSDKYTFELGEKKLTHEFDSIPYLYNKMIKDWNDLRTKLGWSKNGKIANGDRFPVLKLYTWEQATYPLLKRYVDLYKSFDGYINIGYYENIINKDYHYDPITSIEEINYPDGEYVFDVHVPETHRFWCNGFISHNTLLAIEACANFVREYPEGTVYYHETEAAFDLKYAETLGMPIDKITFVEDDSNTIEFLFENLLSICNDSNGEPILYIIDSLDAISDKDEQEREITKGSYGQGKTKKLSEIFRRLSKPMQKARMCLLVISQVRFNLDPLSRKKYTRSGGKSMDMYASIIMWLKELKKIKKTYKGIERPIGIWVEAKNDKSKVGLPYRECEFPILFSFGVDDVLANLEWLKSIKGGLDELGIEPKAIVNTASKIYEEENIEMILKIQDLTKRLWMESEEGFLPKGKKYI